MTSNLRSLKFTCKLMLFFHTISKSGHHSYGWINLHLDFCHEHAILSLLPEILHRCPMLFLITFYQSELISIRQALDMATILSVRSWGLMLLPPIKFIQSEKQKLQTSLPLMSKPNSQTRFQVLIFKADRPFLLSSLVNTIFLLPSLWFDLVLY